MRKSGDGSLDTTNDDRVQHCVQLWSGIQCDDELGNSSAQRHFETTITSVLSHNSSVAPICCEHPPEGKDQSQTGKCTDDGRGFVKTLSGRLARKLQRSASLVHAVFLKHIQTVLDAATVDRCDFVEICCYDVPCCALTVSEITMHRHVRRFLAGLPRTTSEGLVLTSGRDSSEQFDTLQSPIETDFSTVFRICCSSFE